MRVVKVFNDTYGHPVGDDCLRRVGSVLKESARRPGDLAARYGGEEFALVLPGAEARPAQAIAEDVRRRVAELAIPHLGSKIGDHVSVSLGVATAYPATEASPAGLIASADAALYRAKVHGRNRVELETQLSPARAV
jgi:two-component system chemotaxis family response regulator WspR